MTQIKTKIPAELEPAAVGGMVTDSKYVKDRVKNKTQEEVNADTEERVSTLEESVGTGGSVDERITVEKNRAEQAEGVLDGKVATEKQRAEGVEGGLNTRLQTVEQLAEISVGGGDIGIGTAADFESDDPEDLAKVPTVGAMLGGANDGVYDISARHSGTKYADLAAALGTDGANVPVGVRKGGMSVKFVQSSDNNYIRYNLVADEFTTDVTKWSICVDEFLSENSKYIKKEIDGEGKLAFGITEKGDFVFGGGIPTQIKDFITWALASKVNYERGKGLINSFISSLLSTEESDNYLEMDKDAEGKMYHSVNSKGESYFSKILSPTLDEIRDKFKSTIEILVEEATSFPTTKWLPILKNFKRTKVVNGVPTTDEATVSLAWISDVHNEPAVMERFLKFVAKYKSCLDDAIFTGDIVNDRWTDDISAMTSLIGYDKVLIALGNHDLTGYNGEYGPTNVPPLEAFNRYMKPWSGCVFPENASTYGYSYYYKDYSLAKLRLVIIDCMTYDETQNTWFTSVLDDARTNNLHVIVASHVPAGGCANGFDTPFNSFDNGKLSGESLDTLYLTAVDSFINNGGIFVCWMFGHIHTDFCGVMSSHPKQLFFVIGGGLTNRTLWQDTDRIENTNTIDQFNVISIDTDKKFIRIARVGADYDRQGRHRGIIVVSYASDNLRVISEN